MSAGRSLGSTPTGADWCIKALHPSDPIVEVRGIPDHSAIPTVCMNYQTTFTLNPHEGFEGNWGFDMALLPHPINFAWIKSVDSGHPDAPVYATVLNSQLDATTHAGAYKSFSEMCERWRLAYCSCTIYQDGADLANQGTMVVAQVPSSPRYRNVSGPWDTLEGDEPVLYAYPRMEIWDTDPLSSSRDLPNFDASQGMPNAYFGRSREGAYVPLKLTDTCQDWVSASDEVYFTHAYSRNPSTQGIRIPWSDSAQGDLSFPHDSDSLNRLPPAYFVHSTAGAGFGIVANPTSPMLSGNIAHISARNLALSTSYSFFFRYGIEMQVKPDSFLAPQMKLSPPYDPVALDSYFSIARELKDAYPADYNDLGKLWDVIKQAASVALPVLSMAGPYGKSAAMVGRLAIQGGDALQNAYKKASARQSNLTAAQVERLREQASTSLHDITVAQRSGAPAPRMVAIRVAKRPKRKRAPRARQ